jgi:hypothetical protein
VNAYIIYAEDCLFFTLFIKCNGFVQTPTGYITQVGVLSVEWAGFEDSHSGVQYYTVGVGTSPGDTDVIPSVYVGLQTSE